MLVGFLGSILPTQNSTPPKKKNLEWDLNSWSQC